jgi:electron transfer flavoprotein beta subunit
MAAKKKSLGEVKLGDLTGDMALKVTYTSFEPPVARKSGIKVKTVDELVQKLRTEAKVL